MEENNIYKTGDVRVPKPSSRGAWYLLLLLFLLCLVSSFRLAEPALWQDPRQETLLSFDYRQVPGPERVQVCLVLGITGCYLTELEQEYFSLPAGFYIAETNNHLLKPGDVLVTINGKAITEQTLFEAAIRELVPDTEVTLQVRRGSRLVSVTDIFYEGDE